MLKNKASIFQGLWCGKASYQDLLQPERVALAVGEGAGGEGSQGPPGMGCRLLWATVSSPSHSCCVVATAREHLGSVVA